MTVVHTLNWLKPGNSRWTTRDFEALSRFSNLVVALRNGNLTLQVCKMPLLSHKTWLISSSCQILQLIPSSVHFQWQNAHSLALSSTHMPLRLQPIFIIPTKKQSDEFARHPSDSLTLESWSWHHPQPWSCSIGGHSKSTSRHSHSELLVAVVDFLNPPLAK